MAGLPNFAIEQDPMANAWMGMPRTQKAIADKQKEIAAVEQGIVDTTPSQQTINESQYQPMDLMAQYNKYSPENYPESKRVMENLLRYQEESRQGQIQGIEEAKKRLAQYAQQPDQLNLSPLVNLVDNWTGSNLMRGYSQPKSNAEAINALQSAILKSKGQLTESDVANLKNKQADIRGQGATIAGLVEKQAELQRQAKEKDNKGNDKDYYKTTEFRHQFAKDYGNKITGLGEFAQQANTIKDMIKRNGKLPTPGDKEYPAYKSATARLTTIYNRDVANLGALAGGDLALLQGATGQSDNWTENYFKSLAYSPEAYIGVLDRLVKGTDDSVRNIGEDQKRIYARGETQSQFDEKQKQYLKLRGGSSDQNKPKSITQNGHTYTLNETTGEYE